jgi:uncharacterized protein (TIGR03435 family)
VKDDHFDVIARGVTTGDQRRRNLMVQSLLEERFKLRVHRERRIRPIYSMVLIRPDRGPGPALQSAPPDCRTSGETRPSGTSGLMYCGADRGPGRSNDRSMPVAVLAKALTTIVGREVVDRTALPGEWDWDLEWTPADGEPGPPERPGGATPKNGPSIFSALQEQLGIRLLADRAPLDVLVIDSIQRPSAN